MAGMLTEAGDTALLKKRGDKEGDGTDTNTGTGNVGKHASAKAWALEGLWLWRLGGGGDRGLVKEGTIRSS